tara:strand:- start:1356 stop:1646 length:291 start_codon:yes stop_codon:yes gene_type:complete
MSTNEQHFKITNISTNQPLQLAKALVENQDVELSIGEGGQSTSTAVSISHLEKEDGSGRSWIFSGLVKSPLVPSYTKYEAFVSFDHMKRSWFKIKE